MTVIENYNFPRYVYDLLKGDAYSIGMHGITTNKISGSVEEAVDDMLKNGIKIKSGRTINGTVHFAGRLDNKEHIEYISEQLRGYRYGDSNTYLLVAIPTVLKNSIGNTIYVGNTGVTQKGRERKEYDGYEFTSLMDKIIPKEVSGEDQVVPSEYILGTYKLLPDGKIDFTMNVNHVSSTKGIVNDKEFNRVAARLKEEVYGVREAYYILTKRSLTPEDMKLATNIRDRFGNMLQAFNRFYLQSFVNTFSQLLKEDSIQKTTPIDVDRCNEKTDSINYSKLYEGKTGEELFNEQLRVLKGMEVELFTDDDGSIKLHSDRDGEAEEFYRLFNDKEFVHTLITKLNRWELLEYEGAILCLSSDDIVTDDAVAMKIMKDDPYAFISYNNRGLLTRDMLMKAAKSSNFNKDSLYNLPEEYENDLELILAFVDNSNEDNFGFVGGIYGDEFAFTSLSEEVRGNPLLYERLNAKISEFNERRAIQLPLFDVEKEVGIVKGTRMR